MSQAESGAGQFPLQPISRDGVFIVDQLGNVETEYSRAPQRVIHRELLNPQRTKTIVDWDKVVNSGTPTVYVVLQDFGLPFRTVTVNSVFETDYENGEPIYTGVGEGRPAKLMLSCPSYGWNEETRTVVAENLVDGVVELESGGQVTFAHLGESSDYRTGFIQNDAEILAFEAWRNPREVDWFEGYTPAVHFSYEGNILIISSFDEQNIEVIYEKLVNQAELTVETQATIPSETPSELEINEILSGLHNILTPGHLEALTSLAQRTRILNVENASLVERLQAGSLHEQALEVALARNKELLSKTRAELGNALHENERLKAQGANAKQTGFSPSGKEHARTEGDPFGHCATLGIVPERLWEMPTQEAEKWVGGVRRIWSSLYHPDINKEVDQDVIKVINNAADKVLTRLKTGSWGRN